MCKAKKPNYTPPPQLARARTPDNAALAEEARARANRRGGGATRKTVLTALSGTPMNASLASAGGKTVLG